MQSHNEDTAQQATSHSLQSESHDSAVGAIPPSFSDVVPTHTTQTERTWMTESHSLYFTKNPRQHKLCAFSKSSILGYIDPKFPLLS
jgi:hypothetical protein